MPRQKDLKRLVRARIEKTGESYTGARAHLLRKNAPAVAPVPENYRALVQMTDEAVAAKTGRTWREWVGVLDAAGAAQLPHREIAELVSTVHGVPDWWCQTVTVGYERIRGLRDVGQRRGGGYEANKSRTYPVPVSTLHRAWTDQRIRRRWLDTTGYTVKGATIDKSVRIRWNDGTPVDVRFAPKSAGKSQVAVQHGKLPSREAAAELKAFWSEALEALAALLV